MDSNDFMNYFNDILGEKNNNSTTSTYDDADEKELDYLWKEYISYVDDIKADGYKVLRNSAGKHKIVKENY